MPFTPTTWVDGAEPAITAAELNRIEAGIQDAHAGDLDPLSVDTPVLANLAVTTGKIADEAVTPIKLDRAYALEARNLTAGDGLSGGGTLAADRSFAVDSTIARSARQIATGDGLSGGGNLTADRTLAVDGTVVRTSRQVNSGDGLNGGGNLGSNRTLSVDGSVVRTSRQIIAGSGLTGGGNLGADRSLAVDPNEYRRRRLFTISAAGPTVQQSVGAQSTQVIYRVPWRHDGGAFNLAFRYIRIYNPSGLLPRITSEGHGYTPNVASETVDFEPSITIVPPSGVNVSVLTFSLRNDQISGSQTLPPGFGFMVELELVPA